MVGKSSVVDGGAISGGKFRLAAKLGEFGAR
jgi:hypothetical protein